MAETDETEQTPEEQTPQDAAAQQPATEVEAAQAEPAEPEAEQAADAAEAAPAAPETEAAESEAPPPPAEPQETLSPKERRRRARSTHSGQARPQRAVAERQADRMQERRQKAAERSRRRRQEREKAAKLAASGGRPAPAELAPVHEPKRGAPKERQGVVVSSKADKTITVRIDVARQHRRYEKIVRSSSTLHAHDESNEAHEGDVVRVVESRPLSRTKRWRLVEVLERAR
jgi:small subunit ribosomal protein S17